MMPHYPYRSLCDWNLSADAGKDWQADKVDVRA
jgi:hypothetical protein